jgi:hypothetical protein
VEAMLGFEVYSHKLLEAIADTGHSDAEHLLVHSHG